MLFFARSVASRAISASTASATVTVVSHRCCSSTASSSLPSTGKVPVDGMDGGTVSSSKSPLYSSRLAHTLREKTFRPDFQSTKPELSDKEKGLLGMWRTMGNNPEVRREGGAAGGRIPSETESMETQTTTWEGSAVMAVAAAAKKGGTEDGTHTTVAEAYGQTFKDTRLADPTEKVEDKRRRLIYQSRYRGMVEMDLIFGHFARCRLESLDGALLDEYDVLLKQLDSDLFRWLVMNMERPDEIERLQCFHEVRSFVEKERRELLGNI